MATIKCPKCFGAGHLRHFSHIANGDCFGCGASGQVDARSIPRANAPAGRPYKTVSTELGPVTVERYGQGFQASHANGAIWFDVDAGRVINVLLSDALARTITTTAARTALQHALKA